MALLLGVMVTLAQEEEETMDDDEIEIEAIEEDYGYEVDTTDTDFDLSDIDEDELSAESKFPWNKFTVGGALGPFSFGTFTNIGASPEFTYKATPYLRLGASGVYEFYRQRSYTSRDPFSGQFFDIPSYSNTNYGGRAFARVTPFKAIFAHLEYERLERETPVTFNQGTGAVGNFDESLNNVNLGLGLAQAGVNNGGPYILLLYNLMHNGNEDSFLDQGGNLEYPYNAIDFRGGIDIPLGMGDKNKKRKNKKRKDVPESDPE